MSTGIAVVLAIVLVAGGITAVLLWPAPPAATIENPTEVSTPGPTGEGFGIGDVHQVRPPDVRVRITDSHLEIPPAEWIIEIYNAADTSTTFNLRYATPGEPWLGYQLAPAGASGWMEFPETITIAAKSIGRARAVLTVPAGVVPYDTNWCFWIVVSEMAQGNVVAEQTVWWLIEMR